MDNFDYDAQTNKWADGRKTQYKTLLLKLDTLQAVLDSIRRTVNEMLQDDTARHVANGLDQYVQGDSGLHGTDNVA